MSEKIEPIVMPVCPFCKTMLRPQYFEGYYDSFPLWACECEEIPGAEEIAGGYAFPRSKK